MKGIRVVLDYLYKVIESASMLMVVIMTLIISMQVFCRYFLNFTPGWTEEVSRLLLVWITSIGFSIGVYKGLHLAIEIFVRSLPKMIKMIVYVIDELIIVFFGYIIVKYGVELALRMSSSFLPATQWSGAMLYIMVPISGVFMIIFALYNIINVKSEIDKEEGPISFDERGDMA